MADPKPNTLASLLLTNAVISGSVATRAALASYLGYQYGTARDLYEALGYPRTIDYPTYDARYRRQDVAKAIINRPVSATWRGSFTLLESDDENQTPLESAWGELATQLSLPAVFARLDKLTGVGRYGALLLGLSDVTDKNAFTTPAATGGAQLLYVSPFGEGACEIDKYVSDPADPRYGLPELYTMTVADVGLGATSNITVHHTRVIHVADGKLESDVFGAPRLESVWNRLMDLEKLMGGSAEMFWRGARPGYQGVVDKDFSLTNETRDDIQDQIDEFEHHLRRLLLMEGVEFKAMAQQVSDPATHVDIQLQAISAVTGIPKRILTGSERGELASTQDRESWLSLIGARRDEFAEPCVIRPFITRCIELKVLPPAGSDGYLIQWPPLFEESDKDRAEVGRIRATAIKEYTTNPTAETIMPPDAFYRYCLGLSDDEIDMIQTIQGQAINDEERDVTMAGGEEPV